jgi:hypothetical protein
MAMSMLETEFSAVIFNFSLNFRKEGTHNSKIVRMLSLIVAPSTVVLASFDDEHVRPFLWPRRMFMIAIAARHSRSRLVALHKQRTGGDEGFVQISLEKSRDEKDAIGSLIFTARELIPY